MICFSLLLVLLSSFLIYLPSSAGAQMAKDPRGWTAGFFDVLMNEGEPEAVRMLKEESFLGQNSPGAIAHLGDLLSQMKEMSGTTINYEFIRENNLGSRVVRLLYVSNHVYLPIFYEFVFYESDIGWQLVALNVMNKTTEYPFN